MRFARANNAAKRQPERATPWHRMLKDAKDDDDDDSSEATASSTPSDLAPKRKSVEPDEEEVKATSNTKISKVEGATDVTTGSQKASSEKAAVKKGVANFEPEDVSDDEGGDDDSEEGEDDDDVEEGDDDAEDGGGDSEGDDDDEDDDDEEAKPAKKNSPKAAKGNKGSDKKK